MKKKLPQKSEEGTPGPQAAHYVVGQVAGSLFQTNSAASGSLSALFSAAPPAAPLLFHPAPKKSTEVKEQKKTLEVKGPTVRKQRKSSKEKSVADQKLENRESALQNADEEERGKKTPRKPKRKAADLREGGGGEDEEQIEMKRRRRKASPEEEAEEAIKRRRTVFVGNLPVSCTKKMLRTLFRDKGSIESMRFRSVIREDPTMPRRLAAIQRKVHPKKQSINAYVVFKDEEGVVKALDRNGMEIEKNFHIRVDRLENCHDHKRSVFVGNVSFEMSELVFRQHFEQCGKVEAVRLVRDQNSGLGKGFGYVLFEDADSVQLALKLDGSSLEDRSIRVKRSVKKEKVKSKTSISRGKTGKRVPAGPERRGREMKGTGREKGGFKGRTQNQPRSTHGSYSFKGEMVDPTKKVKKNRLKKKQKPRKTVHI